MPPKKTRSSAASRARAVSRPGPARGRRSAVAEKKVRRIAAPSRARKTARRITPRATTSFPIIGLGASAGGLEALKQFLQSVPADSGMAFVIVQHLDPGHRSILTELLAKAGPMPVQEVVEGVRVEPNRVYVIPPNASMEIAHGTLKLTPRGDTREQHRPVDTFFYSLARDQQNRAVGVVLSGTASDGALGLKTIKEQGGITFAQDPESAKFNGMPAAAIATGGVDFVLPPEAIARQLAEINRHPYVLQPANHPHQDEQRLDDGGLDAVFALIHAGRGVDFTHYKHSTIKRRIQRRMMLNRIDRFAHYVEHLKRNPAEAQALCNDILISVTEFFRDAGAFEALKAVVFPELLRHCSAGSPLRIWVAGCAGGEEVYSIAMCLHEFFGNTGARVPVQIFATDVSDAAIEKARAGLYPESSLLSLSSERQRQFFVKKDGGYQVIRALRDWCVFARHDVTRDPPFSRLDLISCRNVMIYLGHPLQRRVIGAFHYALKPDGFLMLGTSESIGGFAELFALKDKQYKMYTRKPGIAQPHLDLRYGEAPGTLEPDRSAARPALDAARVEREADRLLLGRYSPPGVLITEDMNILQFRGQTGAYLEPAPGKASLNLLKMARPELQASLRKAITAAVRNATPVKAKDLPLRTGDFHRRVNLEVLPLAGVPTGEGRFFLVLFDEDRSAAARAAPAAARVKRGTRREAAELEKLRQELATAREYLQSVIEQQEAANEELRSANEEAHSSNEEMQSINEELETAKEELQSTNEELNTMNDELRTVNLELTHVNTDLNNLLDGVDIGIVILGGDLRIRRFTSAAARLLNMIATDIGRPLGDLKPNIDAPGLEQAIREVIRSQRSKYMMVRDSDGRAHDLRVKPYRMGDNRIDGAVMTIVEKSGGGERVAM
jgi:two-component system CheB/CheR fusion protein